MKLKHKNDREREKVTWSGVDAGSSWCGRGGGGGAGGSRWPAVLFSSLSLSLLCFTLLSASSSISLSLSLPSLLFPLSWSSSFFFLSALPCIYRKTGEGDVLGRPLLAAPSTTFQRIKSQASGCHDGRLIEQKPGKKLGEKWGKKIFFFPYLARPGEEEDGAVQNGTVLSFLCFVFFFVFIIFLWGPKNGLQQ